MNHCKIVQFMATAAIAFCLSPVCATAYDLDTGKAEFIMHCSSCHPNGGNIVNPHKTLNAAAMSASGVYTTDDIISKMLRNPGPGMTHFDVKTVPEEQAFLIAAYIITAYSLTAEAGADQTATLQTPVNLNGGESYDIAGFYPLAFSWGFVSKPSGSNSVLTGANTAAPSFIPDIAGDYIVSLVVTDSKLMQSIPDTVKISSINSAPIADAGSDQAIIVAGTHVNLDGSGSYDPDGDAITYLWQFISTPQSSTARLSNPTVANPSFVADCHGDFILQLVVSDAHGVQSNPDLVSISFNNVAPVADAGEDQMVTVFEPVYLNGSGSDANNDQLRAYSWEIVAKPVGSSASLTATEDKASFLPDKPGEYIIQLVVNDGIANSTPDTVAVLATVSEDATLAKLKQVVEIINTDSGMFRNTNMKKAMTQKLLALTKLIDDGQFADALSKLQNDVLPKLHADQANSWVVEPYETVCNGLEQVVEMLTWLAS